MSLVGQSKVVYSLIKSLLCDVLYTFIRSCMKVWDHVLRFIELRKHLFVYKVTGDVECFHYDFLWFVLSLSFCLPCGLFSYLCMSSVQASVYYFVFSLHLVNCCLVSLHDEWRTYCSLLYMKHVNVNTVISLVSLIVWRIM